MLNLFFEKTSDGIYAIHPAGYGALIALVVLILIGVSLTRSKEKKVTMTAKQLAFCSLALALGTVSSTYFKIFTMPFGGTVTLFSMLFIALIGYWYGIRIGLLVAFAFSLLQLVINPYIVHPVQLLFDYSLAFTSLGLSGFFSNQKFGLIKGYLVGIFFRFVFSSISGYVFFASYAPENMNPLIYTILYNGFYIFGEGLLTCIVLLLPPVKNAMSDIKKLATE